MKLDPIHREITLKSQITAKSSQTLLEFLVSKFKYLSREEWEERIHSGKVKVNDREASSGQPLRAGDEVAYTTNAWEEPAVNTNYRVIYEDDHLLVVSKPAPLPVHAIGAYFRNTLMYLLRRDRPEAKDFHLVHRLDSETSGLLVLVKDPKYLKALQKQWGAKRFSPSPLRGEGRDEGDSAPVVKTYRAIVFGQFPEGKKTVDAPIGPKKGSEIRMKLAVTAEEGYPSVTEFELLETKVPHFEKGGQRGDLPSKGEEACPPKPWRRGRGIVEKSFSLIQAKPLTGRTHQIRVHLEYLGFPIVGDKLYAGNDETFLYFYENDWDDWMKEKVLLPRLALHAFKLEFPHPETGKRMEFEDPLAADLKAFWDGI